MNTVVFSFFTVPADAMTKKRASGECAPDFSGRVLFIGNSLSGYRAGSLDGMLREFGMHAESKLIMGATLEKIWKSKGGKDAWVSALREGQFDVVVIQDDLPEYGVPGKSEHWRELSVPFLKAAQSMVEAVREAGAVPILYMSHPYCRLPRTEYADIARCHKEAERTLGVAVAPCGFAHMLAATEAMSADVSVGNVGLLVKDREHLSVEGLYLNACTIALALRGLPPHGTSLEEALPWAPPAIPPAKADFLRRMAREAIVAWPTHLQQEAEEDE